jgi:hypothetical protein
VGGNRPLTLACGPRETGLDKRIPLQFVFRKVLSDFALLA